MPSFQYTALGSGGDRVVGVVAGANEQAVLAELARRDLTPISVKASKESKAVFRRVSARALGNAYLQLGDLLRAGVPLVRGLRLLGRRRSSPRLAEVFRQLGDAISEGETLADAMASRPDVFSRVHVAMIRAGETGGFLEDVLVRLGELVIGQADIRAKVVGNMIYPS
ncbi:MAG: type II secretion system F family protein, partial [Phycisphaerales bacterium]|nr:type II secretion system F family protein [Phycisphaerales bacterium]